MKIKKFNDIETIKIIIILKIIVIILFFIYISGTYRNIIIYKMHSISKINFEKKNDNLSKKQLIKLEKEILLAFLSKSIGKNITKVKQIFIGQRANFGNKMIIIYKTLFYCKILGCKRIIIGNNNKCFIKNKIIDKKNKIIISVGEMNTIKNYDTIVDLTWNFYVHSFFLRPISNSEIFKDEILKNIPKISTHIHDLYIYIRSGDIFSVPFCKFHIHVQPPLCFYSKVLDEFEFRKVYLITQNRKNPVIDKLLERFPFIIYKKGAIYYDIARLIYAYNIVGGGFTTFFSQVLTLNINLKILWTFNLYSLQLEHPLKYNIKNLYSKIKIYTMYNTKEYMKIMKQWTNSKIQRDFMISYNCSKNFIY